MSEERLLHYVRKAIEIQDSGETLDLAELCRDDPELIEAVRETLELDSVAMSASADDGLVGQTLNGRYTLRQCIGIGAMGAVYESDDLSLDRRVAIKVLPPGAFGEGKRRERFLREARVLATLNHPNIVPVYDHGRTDFGLHYIVMERLRGSSLAKIVSPTHISSRGLPPTGWIASELGLPVANEDYIPQVVHWMLEVVEALHAAHAAGVCHRDVKPSNVFLTEDGRAVLLDFGIAARSGDASMTTRGSALGTPAYMAPEQVARDEAATPAMDVYGVCATLYHLISMQPPYTGDSIEVLGKLQREDPKPLKSIDRRLPTDLCAIIEKGLERKAERRYRDMTELEADLRAFLAHMPVRARPITRVTRAWRHMRRRPVYFVAGMALAAIALSIFVPAAWREAEASARVEHGRLRAALPPSVAVEGNVERRPLMDRDERARYISQLDTILSLQPDDVYSRILRCALHQDQGDESAASEDMVTIAGAADSGYLREIVARYRAFPVDGVGIGDLDLTELPEPTTDLGNFVAGFHHRRLGDHASAADQLAKAKEFVPARYLRIGSLLALGSTHRQEPADTNVILPPLCRETTELEAILGGPTARTTYIRGTALFHLRDNEAAVFELEHSLELQPESFGTLNNLGLAYRRLERLEDAQRVLLAASELRPWNENAALNYVGTLRMQNRFDEALQHLAKLGDGDLITLSQRMRTWCHVQTDRSLYLMGKGRPKEAQAAAQRVIDYCEENRARLPADDTVALDDLEQSVLLARYAYDRNQDFVVWVLDSLAADPLNVTMLDAASELLTHPDLASDDFTAAVLESLRHVLQSQANALYSRRR